MITDSDTHGVQILRQLILPVCFVLIVTYTGISKYKMQNDSVYKTDLDTVISRLQDDPVQYQTEGFYVLPNLVAPDSGVISDTDTVLCTQTSLNNLHYVNSLANTWDGPISVAVYSYDDNVTMILHVIFLLNSCSENVRRKVSFHLLYAMSNHPLQFKNLGTMTFDCKTVSTLKETLAEQNWDHQKMLYPVNTLRNVAMTYSTSPFVFNLDIDLVPSKGLKTDMESLLKSINDNVTEQSIAFVIPCFESDRSDIVTGLRSKTDLLKSVEMGLVQTREVTTCPKCHGPTSFSRWMTLPNETRMLFYCIDYGEKFEPYYIAHRKHVPMFDSRFTGYGYDRVSQVCEAYVSGVNFAVINNGFVMHDGLKDKSKLSDWVNQQQITKRQFFYSVFTYDMKKKYPLSTRSCIN